MFSGVLGSLLEAAEERPLSTLYLNQNSPLVQRLLRSRDAALLERMVQILYVQALLAGGHPLRGAELNLLNQALLDLLDSMGA